MVGYAALGKVLEKYPNHPLHPNNNNNNNNLSGGMHSPLSQGLLPSPGSSDGSGKTLLPHIRASLDTNIYTSPNATSGPAGLFLSLTTKSLKHGASHPLAGSLMTLPTAVSGQGVGSGLGQGAGLGAGQGVVGQKGPVATHQTKNKGDLTGVPVTVVIPSVVNSKKVLTSPSGSGLNDSAYNDSDRDHLDTPELHTPALSPRKSEKMDAIDTPNPSGDTRMSPIDVAMASLALESTSMTGHDGGGIGDDGGALSSRDSRRFGSEGATRSYLITPHTAPETPFVSIPSARGLNYSDNHNNDKVTLSVSREIPISMGDESDAEQLELTQGLDQAQDILNGLDV